MKDGARRAPLHAQDPARGRGCPCLVTVHMRRNIHSNARRLTRAKIYREGNEIRNEAGHPATNDSDDRKIELAIDRKILLQLRLIGLSRISI